MFRVGKITKRKKKEGKKEKEKRKQQKIRKIDFCVTFRNYNIVK